MSARQFVEWQAYCAVEPFGPQAEYWRAGLIASVIANVNRTKKSQKAFTPEDFMPQMMTTQPDDPQQDVSAAVVETFHSLAAMQDKLKGPHGE